MSPSTEVWCRCGHRKSVHESAGPRDICGGCRDEDDMNEESECYDFTDATNDKFTHPTTESDFADEE